MSRVEKQLRDEERRHRDGFPSGRRDVADLLLSAADEIGRLKAALDERVKQDEREAEATQRLLRRGSIL